MSGKHTYLETRGMYVCQRYVCMSGETYIPRNYRYVCMSKVCMCVWGNIHTLETIGMYVCRGKHTYLETIGMYV